MDAKDTEYFEQLLQLHNAYRITGFSCEQTVPWERTLDNPISLTFGKFITLQQIPNADFPEHYFNFAVYNELPAKVKVKNPVLTAVSGIHTFGNATTNRSYQRTIHIQNLSGNIIQLALWHEMALTFDIREYEAMEKPVVIAVSSCWVRHFNETRSSSGIQFQHAKIMGLNQLQPIGDGSGTICLTCFSNQANSLIKDCNELLAELSDKNPYHLPPTLKELEDTILPLPAPPVEHTEP
ncbi:DNA helicase [Tanacetum coccineum]